MYDDELEFAEFLQDVKNTFSEDNVCQTPQDVERLINENKSTTQQKIEQRRQQELLEHKQYLDKREQMRVEREQFEREQLEFEQKRQQFLDEQQNLIDPDHVIRHTMQLKQLHAELKERGVISDELNTSSFETLEASDREQVLNMFGELASKVEQQAGDMTLDQAQQLIDDAHKQASQLNTSVYQEYLKMAKAPKTYTSANKKPADDDVDQLEQHSTRADTITNFKKHGFDYDMYQKRMQKHQDELQELYMSDDSMMDDEFDDRYDSVVHESIEPQDNNAFWSAIQDAKEQEMDQGGDDGDAGDSSTYSTFTDLSDSIGVIVYPHAGVPDIAPKNLNTPLPGIDNVPALTDRGDVEDYADPYNTIRSDIGNPTNWIRLIHESDPTVSGYYCPIQLQSTRRRLTTVLYGSVYIPRFVRVYDIDGALVLDTQPRNEIITLVQYVDSTPIGRGPGGTHESGMSSSAAATWLVMQGDNILSDDPVMWRYPAGDTVLYSRDSLSEPYLFPQWFPSTNLQDADDVYPDESLLTSSDPQMYKRRYGGDNTTFDDNQSVTSTGGYNRFTDHDNKLLSSQSYEYLNDKFTPENYPRFNVNSPTPISIEVGAVRRVLEGRQIAEWSTNTNLLTPDKSRTFGVPEYVDSDYYGSSSPLPIESDLSRDRSAQLIPSWTVGVSSDSQSTYITLNLRDVAPDQLNDTLTTAIDSLVVSLDANDQYIEYHTGLYKPVQFYPEERLTGGVTFRYNDFVDQLPALGSPWWQSSTRDFDLVYETQQDGKLTPVLTFVE